ncbi:TPA: RNA pseudouridine synthase [bacterium]|nr:RNA pseudouridine synthase [bacterium]
MRLVVSPNEIGLRLDLYLAKHLPFSRSYLKRLIEEGQVSINGRIITRPAKHMNEGEEVKVTISKPQALKRENILLEIVYEDKRILVISKPAGMITHPTHLVREGTLVNALLGYGTTLSSLGGELRPGIVHRLDKETSGLLVVAKEDEAYVNLIQDLKLQKIKRRYLALVYGQVKKDEGEIGLPIGRAFRGGNKMRVFGRKSRSAKTNFRVIERFNKGYTLLEVSLHTGRTHQIRVHLAHIGHPVVGDKKYGRHKEDTKLPIKRQALHAAMLGLHHPKTKEYLEFHSNPPDDFTETIEYLRSLSQG